MKSAWQQKTEKPQSPDLAPFLISAVLLTIPLAYIINSIAVVALVVFTVFMAVKHRVTYNASLLWPVLLYVLMAMSPLWSIDPPETVKALSKELPLLVIPLAFCFLKLKASNVRDVLRNYSYCMLAYGVFYILRAAIRFLKTGNPDVFFYHELVTKDVNAIYISAMFSVALFYFLAKNRKQLAEYAALMFILSLIILLSSKNIIVIDVLIIGIYYLFFAPFSRRLKVAAAIFAIGIIVSIGYFTKIKDRIKAEFQPQDISVPAAQQEVNKLTIYEAYNQPVFAENDYFNGSAFRVYQARIFQEMLQEDDILFTGYGLNASLVKIKQKGVEYNVYQGNDANEGYHMLNFHNQYIETFADLGIFGFIILLFIQILNFKNSLKSKDFVHIAFAILMISLFLTESFLCRQRGVVFFIILYCLFNTILSEGYTKRKI